MGSPRLITLVAGALIAGFAAPHVTANTDVAALAVGEAAHELPATFDAGMRALVQEGAPVYTAAAATTWDTWTPGDLLYWVVPDDGVDAASLADDITAAGASVERYNTVIEALVVRSDAATAAAVGQLDHVSTVRPLAVASSAEPLSVTPITGTAMPNHAPVVFPIEVSEPAGSIHAVVVGPPPAANPDLLGTDCLIIRLRDPNGQLRAIDNSDHHGVNEITVDDGSLAMTPGTWTLEVWFMDTYGVASGGMDFQGSITVNPSAGDPGQPHAVPPQIEVSAPADAWQDQSLRAPGAINADDLWAEGITGRGVKLAVLDTGIDQAHPDVQRQDWREWDTATPASAPPKLLDWRSFGGASEVTDDFGHGTHVAVIAAGSGAGHPDGSQRGAYPGVAPEASLLAGKVMTTLGSGWDADIIDGMQWAAASGADVVNMSIGWQYAPATLPTSTDPLSQAADILALEHDVLFVIAAYNYGPNAASIGNPGTSAMALTVGANSETVPGSPIPAGAPYGGEWHQALMQFSSRGPTGDFLLKPEVTAPGNNVTAGRSQFSGYETLVLGLDLLWPTVGLPDNPEGNGGYIVDRLQREVDGRTTRDPFYGGGSGTSQASPAVAGAAALLIHAARDTGGEPTFYEIKAALTNTARPGAWERDWAGPARDDGPVGSLAEGAGLIDVVAARDALVSGVTAYTAPLEEGRYDPGMYQPVLQLQDMLAGVPEAREVVLDAAADASVTLTVEDGYPSAGVRVLPSKWLAVPKRAIEVAAGDTVRVPVTVTAPKNAKAGAYSATLRLDVDLGDDVQTLRMPIFGVVTEQDGTVSGSVFTRPSDAWWAAWATEPGLHPVRLAKGCTLTATTIGDAGSAGTGDVWRTMIYNPDQQLVAATTGEAGGEATATHAAPTSGTYTIAAWPSATRGWGVWSDYELTVEISGDDTACVLVNTPPGKGKGKGGGPDTAQGDTIASGSSTAWTAWSTRGSDPTARFLSLMRLVLDMLRLRAAL